MRILTNDEVTASSLTTTRRRSQKCACSRCHLRAERVALAIEESMDIHAKAKQDKHYEYEAKDLHDTYEY